LKGGLEAHAEALDVGLPRHKVHLLRDWYAISRAQEISFFYFKRITGNLHSEYFLGPRNSLRGRNRDGDGARPVVNLDLAAAEETCGAHLAFSIPHATPRRLSGALRFGAWWTRVKHRPLAFSANGPFLKRFTIVRIRDPRTKTSYASWFLAS
jgi:hypothetical protein